MSTAKKPQYPERAYYATRDFVLTDFGTKRKNAAHFALVLMAGFVILLLLSGEAQFTLVSGTTKFLLAAACWVIVFLITRFTSIISHSHLTCNSQDLT